MSNSPNNSQNSFDASQYDLSAPKLTFSEKLAYGAGDLGTSITTNILSFFLLFRRFKDEMQRVLMKQRILRMGYDSQEIF